MNVIKKNLHDQIKKEFPITTQTTIKDKSVILWAREQIKVICKTYKYLEIGSFVGGTLCPFVNDDACNEILSIDNRGRQQPDERGADYDYTAITTKTMLDKISSVNLSIDKIKTFDGDASEIDKNKNQSFNLAFIDGEHTDSACFSDFINIRHMLLPDSIILFDDSSLVYKSIRNICTLLISERIEHCFAKFKDSEMSIIGTGKFSKLHFKTCPILIEEQNWDWTKECESYLILSNLKNRVRLNINLKSLLRAIIKFNLKYLLKVRKPPVIISSTHD